jgi:hypothetical protein
MGLPIVRGGGVGDGREAGGEGLPPPVRCANEDVEQAAMSRIKKAEDLCNSLQFI